MDRNKRRPKRYTVKKAAERMGFSESFVRDLLDNNEIGHIRRQTKSGSSIRIRERDIEQWEEANSVCPGVNNSGPPTDLRESQEKSSGTSLGPRIDALEGSQPGRMTGKKPDEFWNASLQKRLDRLKGESEWIGS